VIGLFGWVQGNKHFSLYVIANAKLYGFAGSKIEGLKTVAPFERPSIESRT
jgi:hypothetical protein